MIIYVKGKMSTDNSRIYSSSQNKSTFFANNNYLSQFSNIIDLDLPIDLKKLIKSNGLSIDSLINFSSVDLANLLNIDIPTAAIIITAARKKYYYE